MGKLRVLSKKDVEGTFTLADKVATIQIDFIFAKSENTGNFFQALGALKETASKSGATKLRIQGTILNEQLKTVLKKRYGAQLMKDENGDEFIDFALEAIN